MDILFVHSNSSKMTLWFDKIRNKFGQETVDIYKDLLKVTIIRE